MAVEQLSIAEVRSARDAIAGHVRWKMTLQCAISMREPLSQPDIHAIYFSSQCPIGRWLSSSATQSIRKTPEYVAVFRLHQDFHHEMIKVATDLSVQDYEAAQRRLLPGASFQTVSTLLANAIMALDRVKAIVLS